MSTLPKAPPTTAIAKSLHDAISGSREAQLGAVGKDVKTPEEKAADKLAREKFKRALDLTFPGNTPEAISEREAQWREYDKQSASWSRKPMQASPSVSIAVGKDVKTPEEKAKNKADRERFAKDVNWMYPGESPEAIAERASAWKAFADREQFAKNLDFLFPGNSPEAVSQRASEWKAFDKRNADRQEFADTLDFAYPGKSPEAIANRASAWKAFEKKSATSGENVGDTQMPSVDADKVVHAKTPLKEVAAATHVGRVFNHEFFIAEKNIFISAAALFVLTCLIPPWQYTADRNGEYGFHTRKPAGYSLIFSPPVPENKRFFFGVGIDSSRLFLEWAVIGVVTGLVIFARQGKRTI